MTEARRVALRLYVVDGTPNSMLAVQRLQAFLASEELGEDVDLEVIDVFARPDQASEDRVLLTPMLIRVDPAPRARVIGSLGERDVLAELVGRPRRDHR